MTKKEKINNYLKSFEEHNKEDYLKKELIRIKPKRISDLYKEKFENSDLNCFYCQTDIRIIQKLIIKEIILPRKEANMNMVIVVCILK